MTEKVIFTETDLPISGRVTIYECLGKHYFKAFSKANGDISLLLKYLIIDLTEINGKLITEDELDNMNVKDVIFLTDAFTLMISNT